MYHIIRCYHRAIQTSLQHNVIDTGKRRHGASSPETGQVTQARHSRNILSPHKRWCLFSYSPITPFLSPLPTTTTTILKMVNNDWQKSIRRAPKRHQGKLMMKRKNTIPRKPSIPFPSKTRRLTWLKGLTTPTRGYDVLR